MSSKIRNVFFLCMASLVLILFGCSAGTNEDGSAEDAGSTAITIAAAFKREDGTALANGTIRFSDNEDSADYLLDENGELKLSGLPREGELTVTVLDQQAQPQETIALSFSQGSVIDVVSDGDGTGHVTLKEDTEEIALSFTLCGDNSIQCELQLHGVRII